MTTILLIFFLGIIGGVLSGLLGIGGGVVMVPLMVLVLGITQHVAQGVSMLAIIPTALVGVWHFQKDKLVNYRLAGLLAAGAICGTLLSSNFVQYIPAADLKKIFGVFVILTGIRMIRAKPKK